MNWFVVFTEESSGWDCDGHQMPHLVAANSKEEAMAQFEWNEYWQIKPNAAELVLPDLSRRKKAFVLW